MATNELELYDRAMFDFFRVLKEDCKTPVAGVFSPPQRAFAALKDLYDIPPTEPDKRVPLPATALHREHPVFSPAAYRFTDRWVNSYRSPPNHEKVEVMGPPQTVTLEYTLEVWTYTQVEMLNIHRQLLLKFRGELAYTLVDLAEYGKKRFSIQNGGITDASVLEPQEEERTLRSTMNVTLNAVLHRPLETLRTVLTVETQVRDLETDELLGTSEVTPDDLP
jgi:hypothetical protein